MNNSFLYGCIDQGNERLEEFGQPDSCLDSRPIYSITKSIVSLLLGIWFKDHPQFNVNSYLAPSLPLPKGCDERWNRLTVAHVLTQCSGLKWHEMGVTWGPKNPLWVMEEQSENWVEHLLQISFSTEPGRHFMYNSGASHLLTHWMQSNMKEDLLHYAQKNLFEPLGIPILKEPGQGLYWLRSPQGVVSGGKGIFCTGRNLPAIAKLVAQGGLWLGNQIVPKAWLDQCLQVQHKGHHLYGQYGYQWWIHDQSIVAAMGFGGQFVLIHRDSATSGVYLRDNLNTDPMAAVEHFRKRLGV